MTILLIATHVTAALAGGFIWHFIMAEVERCRVAEDERKLRELFGERM